MIITMMAVRKVHVYNAVSNRYFIGAASNASSC